MTPIAGCIGGAVVGLLQFSRRWDARWDQLPQALGTGVGFGLLFGSLFAVPVTILLLPLIRWLNPGETKGSRVILVATGFAFGLLFGLASPVLVMTIHARTIPSLESINPFGRYASPARECFLGGGIAGAAVAWLYFHVTRWSKSGVGWR